MGCLLVLVISPVNDTDARPVIQRWSCSLRRQLRLMRIGILRTLNVLIPRLIELYTGIAEDMEPNPFRPKLFLRLKLYVYMYVFIDMVVGTVYHFP